MRREITLIIVLIAIVIALALTMKFASGAAEEGDARKFVMEDLGSRFPDADKIEVVSFDQKTNELGQQYYVIKARVSSGLATPCPNRTNYYYTYPMQNFAPAPPEYVVKECSVCASRPCVIAFEEEAIIASHTLPGTEEVQLFISEREPVAGVEKQDDRWIVSWTDVNSSQHNATVYQVAVSTDGWILGINKTRSA